MSGVCSATSMFMLVLKSNNEKTGPMCVSTSPMWTCPRSCPFRSHGCYGAYGPVFIWWKRISQISGDSEKSYKEFLQRCREEIPDGEFWRHNQAGDFIPASGFNDRISERHAFLLARASKGKRAFSYTHYPVVKIPNVSQSTIDINRFVIESLNAEGFSVNVSANSLAHADDIVNSGLQAPVTTLLPRRFKKEKISSTKTPEGKLVVTCPAVIKEGMTCRKCKACMNPRRKVIIGFPAHGTGFRHCESVMKEWEKGVSRG